MLPQGNYGFALGQLQPICAPGSNAIELRARTASFKWQLSPLLLYSLPWHRARTEPSRKVSCQSASCRATLFGGSREKCFASRRRSVDGTEYVTYFLLFSVSSFLASELGLAAATPIHTTSNFRGDGRRASPMEQQCRPLQGHRRHRRLSRPALLSNFSLALR